jgi:hypothetical protein
MLPPARNYEPGRRASHCDCVTCSGWQSVGPSAQRLPAVRTLSSFLLHEASALSRVGRPTSHRFRLATTVIGPRPYPGSDCAVDVAQTSRRTLRPSVSSRLHPTTLELRGEPFQLTIRARQEQHGRNTWSRLWRDQRGSTKAHLHLLNQQSLRAAPHKSRQLALYEISQKTFADLQVVVRIALGDRLI